MTSNEPDTDRRARSWTSWVPVTVVAMTATLAVLVIFAQFFGFPPASGTIIDGFPIGGADSCGSSSDASFSCDTLKQAALETLDHRDPGHPQVVTYAVHGLDYANADFFPDGMPFYGNGAPQVMVMALADGSLRAVGIHCGVGGCGASDDPPLKPGQSVTLCHPDKTKWNQCEQIISLAHAELDAVDPIHPEVLNTLLDTKNADAQYSVEFYASDGLLRAIDVDCTVDGCTVRRSTP
jgi:hypothetical protein